MPGTRPQRGEWTTQDEPDTRVLGDAEERDLLRQLADCREALREAVQQIPGASWPDGDRPVDLPSYVAATCAGTGQGAGARLSLVTRDYAALRSRLALANLRLVAHVAKQFRDRGIPHADLMQEGFCGLLEAIDRFDLAHQTRLATYATWWIRQAMQSAVASGAYPVRLNPRHLRQLAQIQDELDRGKDAHAPAISTPADSGRELIRCVHAATRPTISLDAAIGPEGRFSLLQAMSVDEADKPDGVDAEEAVARLMGTLRPREQEVLALRFGLGGKPRLSLSQVGKALAVSKERARQIQDRAIEKLRKAAAGHPALDILAAT